jgi:Flp pilus assembly pilin Flp
VLYEVTDVLLGEERIHDTFTITRRRTSVPSKDLILAHLVDGGHTVIKAIRQLWTEESGQDVAEYAVMLAVILVIVIGTVRLIGSNANNVFSQVQSSIAGGG